MMKPVRPTVRQPWGYALVSALFLLVVLTALGTYMISVGNTQHYTTAFSLQGARAYHAARSGTEWGSVRALSLGSCPATPSVLSPADGLDGGDLDGFAVTVTLDGCTTHREGTATFNVYTISAHALTSTIDFGQAGYAARSITLTITDAP